MEFGMFHGGNRPLESSRPRWTGREREWIAPSVWLRSGERLFPEEEAVDFRITLAVTTQHIVASKADGVTARPRVLFLVSAIPDSSAWRIASIC